MGERITAASLRVRGGGRVSDIETLPDKEGSR